MDGAGSIGVFTGADCSTASHVYSLSIPHQDGETPSGSYEECRGGSDYKESSRLLVEVMEPT